MLVLRQGIVMCTTMKDEPVRLHGSYSHRWVRGSPIGWQPVHCPVSTAAGLGGSVSKTMPCHASSCPVQKVTKNEVEMHAKHT